MPFNYRNFVKVHEKVHDLKKQFSGPHIYSGKSFDLTKDWYVYYSLRNEEGKLVRQPNIKAGANYYQTKKERLAILKQVQRNLLDMLESGETLNFYKETLTVDDAFIKGMELKAGDMTANTFKDFNSRIEDFKNYLNKNGFKNQPITSVEKIHVIDYLNEVAKRSSNRNRNNTRIAISSLFSVLYNNEIIPENFISKVEVKKAIPQRNKTYSDKQVNEILSYIQKVNPQLRLYILFVSYNFLRPIEVSRLTVGDIKPPTLKVWVKQGTYKEKIIPQLLLDELPDLTGYNDSDLLFTPNGIGIWEADERNRRDNFSKQFKVIKDHFGLGVDYGIYSFRHTSITRLYRTFRKTATPFEVKSKLMLITGHSTMTALDKYLRDLDAEISDDYSKHLK